MSNPAFIIDGFMEKLILKDICPGKPAKRLDLNGKNVSLEAMAEKIASIIRAMSNRYYPIIIVVDKEKRDIDCINMAEKLKELIISEGIDNCQLCVGVADMMIENWIIADWQSLNSNVEKPENTDGLNGTFQIKKLQAYDKTTDGVNMFKKANPSLIYQNSPSYKYFIDNLAKLDCAYLDKIKPSET